MSDEIVGHKTFSDGHGGYRHEPLRASEAEELLKRLDAERAKREALMPDEEAARHMFGSAHARLKELGWNDAIYCPKDGTVFEVIEAGSTGIHKCVYEGEWPNGHWWIVEDGDMSPSRPTLWRPLPSNSNYQER